MSEYWQHTGSTESLRMIRKHRDLHFQHQKCINISSLSYFLVSIFRLPVSIPVLTKITNSLRQKLAGTAMTQVRICETLLGMGHIQGVQEWVAPAIEGPMGDNLAPCAPQSTPTNELSKNARYDLQCHGRNYRLNETKQVLELPHIATYQKHQLKVRV